MPPNIAGFIDDKLDLYNYQSWILSELNDWESNPHDLRNELSDIEIEESFSEIRSLVEEMMETYIQAGSPEDVNSAVPTRVCAFPFERFIFMLTDESAEKYNWHIWKDDDTILTVREAHIDNFDGLTEDDLGKPVGLHRNSDRLQSSILLHKSALIQHCYESRPEPLSWKLTKIDQGSKFEVYFGCRDFSEIDAVSRVPWIDPRYHSQQFARKALDGTLQEEDEWQRLVDIHRINGIRDFANDNENYMINPTLIYADKSHPSIAFKKSGGIHNLSIDFDFLEEKNGVFYDFIPYPKEIDRRPLWIVDGQHRIRGMGSSPRGSRLDAPFILIVGDGRADSRREVAKIFTEVNTTARALDKMHQTYLRYAFGMSSRTPANDFAIEQGRDGEEIATLRSRPNRMSYKMALNLAADQESPLYNSIQFQDPAKTTVKLTRMRRHLIVKSTNWMQIAKSWFRGGGIYQDEGTDKYCIEEVKNFFIAIKETCNHIDPVANSVEDWTDGEERWKDWEERRKKKPIIQGQGPFRAIMHMVDFTIREVAKSNPSNTERPFSVMQIKSVLAPLSNIDWLNDQALNKLKGRGNLSVPHLRRWMETAITAGEVHSVEEVMNPNLMSMPGKGINAPPENDGLKVELFGDGDAWPGSLPLKVSIERPVHSLRPVWGVECIIGEKRYTINVAKAWYSVDERRTVLSIKEDALRKGTEILRIRGSWSNGIDDAIATPRDFLAP